jgi:ribose/xylose/arabinose/galactoside ABC-type transport system permease subunit
MNKMKDFIKGIKIAFQISPIIMTLATLACFAGVIAIIDKISKLCG